MKALRNITTLITVFVLFTSCADLLNVNPDDVLLEENYPSTITELYSGYMGIAATVQSVADKASFLEGLRGDFLEPTANANNDMVELYNYDPISVANDLANPVGYYNIILNANDYIGHAADFFRENPTSIDEETFFALVGGAIRYKTWAYLMLAKIYGEAIWIDDPLIEYKDISQFPVYDFDQLINNCISLMENGIDVDGVKVDGKGIVKWSSVLFPNTTSDYSWDCIDPAPEILLGELYLFAGNYQLAFDNLFALLRIGSEDNRLEVTKSEYNQEWIKLFRGFVRKEAVFTLTYEYNYNQTNHLIDYYSNNAPNKYYLRPTQVAMDRFYRQKQSNGNPGDFYRGVNVTFKQIDNEWVVYKFIS
ncbi:MAG: hypothetical protein JW798_08415, partial [Prolixibacteraceae bacterium]|nr:hypothetical protein [Prolixibacteraceae bacterium]